jgi:hypothetical protein
MMKRFANVLGAFKYKLNTFSWKMKTNTTTNLGILTLLIWSVWDVEHRMAKSK